MNAHTDLYDQAEAGVKGAMTKDSGTRRLLARRELVTAAELNAYEEAIYAVSCIDLPQDQICVVVIVT